MEYVKLGTSDLITSRLCFGGCQMGGHGWGVYSLHELQNAIAKSLEFGVNFFDTADIYGLGSGEELLGKSIFKKREKIIIGSKFGVRIHNGQTLYDNSSEWIESALTNSLRRLKTDYIDLYQIHYRDHITPLSEIVNTLIRLKKKGLIRYFGLSNLSESDINDIKPYVDYFTTFQNEYSLANRENELLITNLIDDFGLTGLTWGSLGQGILTGKYDENTVFEQNDRRTRNVYKNFHGSKLKHNLHIVECLNKVALEYSKPISAIALRWILDRLSNSVVIVGIKNPIQLEANLKAFDWQLDDHYKELLTSASAYKDEV